MNKDFGQLPPLTDPFDPTVPGPFDPEALLCEEDEFFNVSTLTCEPLAPGGTGPGGTFPTIPIPGNCDAQLAQIANNLLVCQTRGENTDATIAAHEKERMVFAVVGAGAGILVGVMLGRLL